MPPCMASASVTAGLKWAPEIGASARISATKAAPVAMELASKASATFPPASRSAMIPEPTTAISRNAVPRASVTARWTTAGLRSEFWLSEIWLREIWLDEFWFGGANEGAEKLAIDLWSQRVDVDSLLGEKFASVLGAIDARGLDFDLGEAGCCQLAAVVVFFQGSGDATDPGQHALADLGQNFAAGHDVGDGETAARLEHAEGFTQNFIFVGGEIDYAVGNDDVDRIVGQRDVFDFTFQEFDIVDGGLAFVVVGEGQHFVGHVEAVGFACRPDAAGGEQHVDAAAGSEIEDGLAGVQLG